MNKLRQIHSLMDQISSEVSKMQNVAEKSLKKAPEGTMWISGTHGKPQYFLKKEKEKGRGSYIPKKNMKLIKALAQKDYDQKFLKECYTLLSSIEEFQKRNPEDLLEKSYTNLSETRRSLISSYTLTDEEYADNWLKEEFNGKSFYADSPVIITERGERVRSKSEKIIADKLYAMGIPYKYECPVYLDGFGTVYPDFTLLNKHTRKEYYYEHFGMMDDPEYSRKAFLKLNDYMINGYYPGDTLLFTFETSDRTLDMQMFEGMMQTFLLKEG